MIDYQKRTNDRIEECVALNLKYMPQHDAYIRDNIYIPILDIKVLEDEKWQKLIDQVKKHGSN